MALTELLGPLWLTLKLAALTTVLLLLICIPLAWWLTRGKGAVRNIIEVLIGLPLVLPPTVLGFYLLLLFSPGNAFGAWLEQHFDLRLVFSFSGLVIASILFSLPFMAQPILGGFRQVPGQLLDMARCCGRSEWQILLRVQIPCSRPAILAGVLLSFAHTLGEFGVALMIGGNIAGETRVMSIAIFQHVEALRYSEAHIAAATLVVIAFLLLLALRVSHWRMEPGRT